ncbi:hypothetical protein [Actinomycetospora soli]|uniref:hypothetical protein n=1 Tax=Actinomycetospora soli TaxID=2893887 RepID=UPI001E419649|nr:hypothetical protein [Actinomycetospora soli]MCD2191320.1 hypothetical protein [Actinomycetospora soli]
MPAVGALLAGLVALAVDLLAPPGVGSTLLIEAVVAVMLALSAAAVLGWRRTRADRPDLELVGGPAPGTRVELVGLGRSWPDDDTEALAEVRDVDVVWARLYRLTPVRRREMPVVVAHRPGPDEPHEPMGRPSRAARRARRLQLRETAADGQERAGRVLLLEHRTGTTDDLDTDPDRDGEEGRAVVPAELPGEVPAVVLRLFDRDQGRPVAGAHAYRRLDLDDWVVPTATHTLWLRAARTRRLTPRGRPTRRTFVDDDDDNAGYVVRSRRRPKRWEFTAPPDLDIDAVLLCLWLVHLLDVHTLLGRGWEPDGPEWRPVEETFPARVGPGGFGDVHLPPSAHPGGGGGGN